MNEAGSCDYGADVLVVGAGPTGCAAALAFAAEGAQVILVDGQPAAAKRFAGEWMHPPAVRALRKLGVDTDSLAAVEGHGFVLFGDDGRTPVQLPYVRGTGIARLHHELVDELRAYVVRSPRITYLPYHSFKTLQDVVSGSDQPIRAVLEDKQAGRQVIVEASRVLGADGRKSKVRHQLGDFIQGEALSFMMGVELHDVVLPYEGLGHVFFGGPGPALFYRVSPTTVRGCLDVPVSAGAEARNKQRLLETFDPVLPAELRSAFARSLEKATPWASTRFQPRVSFGRGNVWLAGDAVGHVHPVSGMGMTFGILDAVAAARASSLESYRASREVYVSELLTNVLYLVFRRHDESAARVRRGLLKMLRKHPVERRRTMQILTSEDDSGATFVRSFLRASGYVMSDTMLDLDSVADMSRLPGALRDDLQWLQWPLGAFLGDVAGSQHYRPLSRLESPFPSMHDLMAAGATSAKQVLSSPPSLGRGTRRTMQRWLSSKQTP